MTLQDTKATNADSTSTGSFLLGVRVIEIANELGEYCGKVLAGLGADVIKIEPVEGESTRKIGPYYQNQVDDDHSLFFWHYNFGKRSVVLDLDNPVERAKLESLLKTADVLLDTRPRDYLPSRGLTAERLAALNPALIHARITPFGDDGPWADYAANDLVHLALGGMVMNCGYDANLRGEYDTPPVAPQMNHAYHIAGEVTAIHVIAALCYRNVSGQGQSVSTSVHEAVSANTEQDTPDWVYARKPHLRRTCAHSAAQTTATPQESASRAAAEANIIRTKDGRWFSPYMSYIKIQSSGSGAIDPIDRILSVVKAYGGDDDLIDRRYYDEEYRRTAGFHADINALLMRFGSRLTAADRLWWEAQQQGLAWADIRKPHENLHEEHWQRREAFVDVEHPDIPTPLTEVRAKWLAPGLPWRSGPAAPKLGQHTVEVLAETQTLTPASLAGARQDHVQRRVDGPVLSKLGKPFALAGVRVLDVSWALASAGAGRFFAAMGAEVLKIEHRSALDGMRGSHTGRVVKGGRQQRDRAVAPIVADESSVGINRSGAFMEINAGKMSVSLDLKSEEGKVLFRQLLAQADIVVEGFSPGTFQRMGFSYEELKKIKSDIIYVQQSGTGQHGTYGRLRTFGPTAQAFSGLSEMSGLAEPYSPAGIGYSYLDWFGAYQMALAMVSALYRRDLTGNGCWIDSSQVEAGIYLTGTAVLDYTANGRSWQRRGNRSVGVPAAPHGIYRGKGYERWIAIVALTEQHWSDITDVLDHDEWRRDPRLASLDLRVRNQDYLDELISAAVADRDVFDLMAALQARKVPAGVCQTAQDRCDDDPQLRHLQWTRELKQSEIGTWPVKDTAVKMSETPPYIGGILDRHGPSYDEDTDRVLRELLDFTPQQLQRLRREGVL